MSRLLALNLGNTRLSFGLFDGERLLEAGALVWQDVKKLPYLLRDREFSAAAVASVAPSRNARVIQLLKEISGLTPQLLGRDIPVPIPVLCREPKRVGIDRVLNGLAGFHLTRGATIVVDAGTAITVDMISSRGEFCGGAIAPGLAAAAQALHRAAELLPEVALSPLESIPSPIGRDTDEAIRAGIYWGAIGAVQRIIEEQIREFGESPAVLATGGDGRLLADRISLIRSFHPHLTLEGIRLAWEESRRNSS